MTADEHDAADHLRCSTRMARRAAVLLEGVPGRGRLARLAKAAVLELEMLERMLREPGVAGVDFRD